ncbi:hypothetical protein M0805_003344 [Coniferiporia weirii]|nr:hypothetical protein M0805_003344 [Coniferiporia weirii]
MSPDLGTWTRARLTALYTAPVSDGDTAFTRAFDHTFAPAARMHADPDREKMREDVRAARGAMQAADVKFDDVRCEIDSGSETGIETGMVRGTWTVTRSMKFRVRAAPAQMQRVATFEARVEADAAFAAGDGGAGAGEDVDTDADTDPRRIVHFVENVEENGRVSAKLHHTATHEPENESKGQT